MMQRWLLSGMLILTLFFWFSCAGSPAGSPTGSPAGASRPESSEAAAPESTAETSVGPEAGNDYIPPPDTALFPEMAFVPAGFPSLETPPGVGVITADKRDKAGTLNEREKADLSESYRSAYIDGLFRTFPLAGVLGGDMVHGWPDKNPSGWVQNWRTSAPQANSWGIPALVLAIRGLRAERETAANPESRFPSGGRVFIVRGKLLDHYGKSAGIKGANGDMGYGSPRGYEFLYEGKLAQRFDLGLITVDREGKGVFLPEDPPSLENTPPSDLGVFADAPASGRDVRSAYITAWMMALDRGIEPMESDGPGQYLSFTEGSWDFPGTESLKGLYIQSFDRRTILLVLPDSSPLPPYPRFIASPFLDVLLSTTKHSLAGGEDLKPLDIKFSGGDEFSRALMKGLALYGIPLTDPVPVTEAAKSGPDNGEEGAQESQWEIQRFSRGWISGPPTRAPIIGP